MRTFVAIELSEQVRTCVASLAQTVRNVLRAAQLDRHVRWVPTASLHLTIRFLGETPPAQYSKVVAGLSAAVRGHPPLCLVVSELGCFPNMRSPRVIWLGMEGNLEPLRCLQTSIEAIVQTAGYEPEQRAFSPHLTIGRSKRKLSKATIRAVGARMEKASQKIEASNRVWRKDLTFEARELVLMQSMLRPEGATYRTIERFPFD